MECVWLLSRNVSYLQHILLQSVIELACEKLIIHLIEFSVRFLMNEMRTV